MRAREVFHPARVERWLVTQGSCEQFNLVVSLFQSVVRTRTGSCRLFELTRACETVLTDPSLAARHRSGPAQDGGHEDEKRVQSKLDFRKLIRQKVITTHPEHGIRKRAASEGWVVAMNIQYQKKPGHF